MDGFETTSICCIGQSGVTQLFWYNIKLKWMKERMHNWKKVKVDLFGLSPERWVMVHL